MSGPTVTLPWRALLDEMRRCSPARLHRAELEALRDAVLDAVVREVTPIVEREWCGGEVLRRIRDLSGNTRQASKVGPGTTNIGKVEE